MGRNSFSYSSVSLILLFLFLFFFILYFLHISHTHVYLSGWCIYVCSILCDLSAPIVKIPLDHFSTIPLSNTSKLFFLVQKKELFFRIYRTIDRKNFNYKYMLSYFQCFSDVENTNGVIYNC